MPVGSVNTDHSYATHTPLIRRFKEGGNDYEIYSSEKTIGHAIESATPQVISGHQWSSAVISGHQW